MAQTDPFSQSPTRGSLEGHESRLDPEIRRNPFPFYAALRRERPVYYDPKLDVWLVSRYEDVVRVLRDPENFSLERGYQDRWGGEFLAELEEILERDGILFVRDLLAVDPPEHTRLRKLLEPAFSGHRVKSLEGRIRRLVGTVLDEVARRGQGCGMADVGVPITARIICEQLGLDFTEIGVARIQRWTRALLAQMGRMQTRAEFLDNARALCELHHFLVPAIRERQRKPREDMISDLVHARLPGDDRPALSFPEQVSCVRAILVAGNDTTAAAIANLLWILATEPDALHWLADHAGDSQALTLFLEELLRLLPPVHGLYRTALREVEVGEVRIPAGAQVCVLFASANRDEALFAEPNHFLRQRPEAIRHLTFGAGIHRCLGAALARMELRIVAEEIVRRFARIHLTVPVESLDYLPTLATQTLTRLPLSFEARDSC